MGLRRGDGTQRRPVGTREVLPKILVVCEGKKTEPYYFEAFAVTSCTVEVVGTGRNTLSLVEEAERLQRQGYYQVVWCVFDRDSFTKDQFNTALQKADALRFHVAWSNECFELWYILHFAYLDAGVSRATYAERLEKYLGRPYRKNDPSMYDTLITRQPEALRNARRLRASYQEPDPAEDNPCTAVQDLVEFLNRHSR